MILRTVCIVLALSLFVIHPSPAAEKEEAAQPLPEPKVSVTRHTGRFNGETVRYTATAGETYVNDEQGKPVASIFSVAYTRDGVSDPASRPVVFLFNGGPGSAALWLHMGAFGPKRVVLPSDARDDGAAPYTIEDNPLTILDVADIVFIDPVGTGYSRALGEKKDKDFWGITQDAKSVADFIRTWITENQRWNSPKYVGGESYGTVRTSAVVNELEGGINDVALNGVILISALQAYWDLVAVPGNDWPLVNFLPTYAATAVYHGKVEIGERPLADFLEEVRDFAIEDYLPALYLGDRLDEERRAYIRSQLAAYTGLSEDYIENANLRVSPARFQKELLRDRELTVGRLDARFTGRDYDAAGETPDFDPSFYGIDASYTAAVNDYLGRELGVKFDRQYEILSFKVNSEWDARIEGSDFIYGVGQYLGRATRENSDFRIWVASGYYDMATPFFGIENALSTVGVVPERVDYTYYEAGHMMYIHQPSIEALLAHARAFIEAGR